MKVFEMRCDDIIVVRFLAAHTQEDDEAVETECRIGALVLCAM